MNKLYLLLFAFTIMFSSCVDEYDEANPPRLLDSPAVSAVSVSDTVLQSNETTEISVVVSDAPGGIDSVSAVATDALGTEYGSFTSNVSELRENEKGTINLTYTAPEGYGGDLNVTIIVYDSQINYKGDEVNKASTAQTLTLKILCEAAADYSGTYTTIADGNLGDGDGGASETYSDLESSVIISKKDVGLFNIDDMSFGQYPVLYEDTAPPGTLSICGTTISDNGDTDQYDDPFTINGMVNDDGTITLTWSNTYGDGATVTLIKQ